MPDNMSSLATQLQARTRGPRWHYLTTPLTSTSWDGETYSTTAKTLIDLSATFGVPAGVRAVYVRLFAKDTASAGASGVYIALSGTSTVSLHALGLFCDRAVNNALISVSGEVPCDANGDIYYQVGASGVNTMTVDLQIWGYYL